MSERDEKREKMREKKREKKKEKKQTETSKKKRPPLLVVDCTHRRRVRRGTRRGRLRCVGRVRVCVCHRIHATGTTTVPGTVDRQSPQPPLCSAHRHRACCCCNFIERWRVTSNHCRTRIAAAIAVDEKGKGRQAYWESRSAHPLPLPLHLRSLCPSPAHTCIHERFTRIAFEHTKHSLL